eukprot:9569582-Alexandrium_andersonii.AAC.1
MGVLAPTPWAQEAAGVGGGPAGERRHRSENATSLPASGVLSLNCVGPGMISKLAPGASEKCFLRRLLRNLATNGVARAVPRNLLTPRSLRKW